MCVCECLCGVGGGDIPEVEGLSKKGKKGRERTHEHSVCGRRRVGGGGREYGGGGGVSGDGMGNKLK